VTAELPASAPVVVVGGGVIGVSIAFHLAGAGVRDVVLLERGALGSGSTVKAAGGVRAQFSDELNVRLAARSLELLGRFGERPGQEIDLHRVGYLWLLDSEGDVAAFRRSVELQNRLGVPSRMLDVEQALRLSPYVRGDGLQAAAFSPDDGHCTPESVVLGYASAARRLGARLVTGCTVTAVRTSGGEVTGVVTDRGEVGTGTVVCAAGAWSAALGEMAGVELPVVPLRRQVVVTGPVPGVPPDLPMTIDFATSLYFHREGRGLLVGMSDPDEQPGFSVGRSDGWLPRLSEAVRHRAPGLLDTGLAGGWAGLYEVTPDANALVGEAPDVSRFLYATGFSGHGFVMGPVMGEVVRDLVLGVPPAFDVAPLDARRFRDGTTRPETALV
jgi:sarcosine oxidase, subunit beta